MESEDIGLVRRHQEEYYKKSMVIHNTDTCNLKGKPIFYPADYIKVYLSSLSCISIHSLTHYSSFIY